MFTGIIGDVGEVVAASPRGAGVRAGIACRYDVETIALGASIACVGPCLTVVETGRRDGVGTFDVEASSETLARTTLGKWRARPRGELGGGPPGRGEMGG